MALVVADRVQETTSTTSTSDYVLLGAAAGYQSFGAVLANGDTTYYAITNDTDWEVGIGTYSTTGPTLARTTILASSSGGSAVSWGVGVKNIFISYAASKSVYLDTSGNLSVADKIIHTGDTNTAIRFPAADTVSIETNGTERFKVENSTITTTVPIVLPADPTTSLQAATKSYVDTIASASIHYHTPVRVESPTALTVTYNNGTSGVGATLTNAGTQAVLVLDGITLSVNDRVLIYTQADQTQNGVYTVTNVGSVSTNWVMTRSTDTNTYAPSSPTALGAGDAFFVSQGVTGAGELYVCNTTGTITFGTTNITFVQVAATAVYTAGTGISVTNNVITNTAPDQTVALTQGGATTITGTYPNFTISSTDTTYTAGGGIGLAGTTFSVAAGTGLTQDADGLSHADTSSQASVDNTGATFVQDINLDGFGHVTGAASVTVTPSLIGAPQNDGTGATGTWGISISGNATNVTGTVAIANGGTGATTAPQALTNLAAAPLASPALTGNVTVTTNSASAAVTINQTGAGNAFVVEDSTNPDATPFVIDASGDVGIGTSSPAAKLDVFGGIRSTSVGGNSQIITTSIGDTTFANNGVSWLTVKNGAPADSMRIAATGNVGIGNSNPTAKLEVVTTSGTATAKIWSATNTTPIADLELQRGTNATWGADVYGDYRLRNDSGALLFQYGESTVTTERLRLGSAGQFGIGGANYGTSGQTIISAGSAAAPAWGVLPVAGGGTGASDAGTARTNLGLAIGSNVQAWDANLDQIAALAPTADNFIVGNGTAWTLETPANALASLGVTATAAELNFVDGVTSAIQTQLDAKAPLTGTGTSGTWPISISGNAATVTNGVYTTGAQTIAGEKTFSDTMVIRNGSPTINFRDTDANVGFIHVNANQMYVLRGSNDATTWTQVGGQWPFIFNLANNDATCGGNFLAIGNVTAYSDVRLKTDLEQITDAIEKVQSLTGYTYTRIDSGQRQTGLIAQDVQKILPEAVMDDGEHLSLAYGNLVGLLVEAIKAQQVQIDELRAKLEV